MGEFTLEHAIVAGHRQSLFQYGWLLFFAGIPFLGWSALGLLLILMHWFMTRPRVVPVPVSGTAAPQPAPVTPRLYRVAVFGLLSAYGISLLSAVSFTDALGQSIGFGLLLLFGLTYAYRLELAEPGWWQNYIWPVPVAGVVSASVGLSQYAEQAHRVVGVHSNPNAYSTALLIGLFLGSASLSRYRDYRRWLLVPYAVVMIAAMLTTGSRGVWVGTVAGVGVVALVLAIQRWSVNRWRGLFVGVGAFIVVVLAIVLVYNSVEPAMQRRMVSIIDVGANQDRVVLYRTMGRMIQAHPWFGVGMGNIGFRFAEFMDDTIHEVFGTAHNHFLQSLGEVGVYGTAFVILLWVVWLFQGRPTRDAPPALVLVFGLLVALFVRDQFDNSLTNFYIAFLVHWLGGTVVGARAARDL